MIKLYFFSLLLIGALLQTLNAQNQPSLSEASNLQHRIHLLTSPDPRTSFELEFEGHEHKALILERMFDLPNSDFYYLKQNNDYIAINIDGKPSVLFCGAQRPPANSMFQYHGLTLTENDWTAREILLIFFDYDQRSQCLSLIADIQRWYDDRQHCEYILVQSTAYNSSKQSFVSFDHETLSRDVRIERYFSHHLQCNS